MEKDYIEIDFKDLIKRIWRFRWKILVFAIIGALVFGLVGAYLGDRSYKEKQAFLEKFGQEDDFLNFSLDEIVCLKGYKNDVVNERNGLIVENLRLLDAAIAKYNSYNIKIEALSRYQKNGVLPNLDYEHVSVLTLSYGISLGNYQGFDTDSIIKSTKEYFDNAVLSKDEINKVLSKLDWDISYEDFAGTITTRLSGYTYYITAYAPSKDDVEIIRNHLVEIMNSEISEVKKSFSSYNLDVGSFNEEYSEGSEDAVFAKRLDTATEIIDANNERDKISDALPDKVVDLYTKLFKLWEVKEEDIDKYNKRLDKQLLNEKYIAIGFACGAILVVLLICIQYLFTKTIKTVDEVKSMYGSKVVGILDENSGVDEFLAMAKFIEVTANVKKYKSCFLGGDMSEDVVGAREIIKKALERKVDCALSTKNVATNLQSLYLSDAVIMLVKLNSTKYEDVNYLMDAATEINKPLIGFIVLK